MRKLSKKLTTLTSLVCISVFVTIYGCSSEDIYNEVNSTQVPNLKENPYEFVGEYHNIGLMFILQELKESAAITTRGVPTIPTLDEIRKLTGAFCQENILESNGVQYPIITSSPAIYPEILPTTRSLNNHYSSDVQHYISLFEQNLKNPKDIHSIDDFKLKIKKIEQKIQLSNIKEEDKTVLLLSYAVGRHSLEFWLEVSGKGKTPLVKTRSESFSDWWSNTVTPAIEAVVTADFAGAAAGAIGGLISGGTVGSIVPGPGTVTGAVAGAVEGAASGAIYSSVVGGVTYYFSK